MNIDSRGGLGYIVTGWYIFAPPGGTLLLRRLQSSAFWSRPASGGSINLNTLNIKLHAGYTDGHVEPYCPAEVVPMKVSFASDGRVPYPYSSSTDPGIFYLPGKGLR